jgi:hypothetical protein
MNNIETVTTIMDACSNRTEAVAPAGTGAGQLPMWTMPAPVNSSPSWTT